MKIDTTDASAHSSGRAAMRWAFSATLALILFSLLGTALAFPIVYLLSQIEALKSFMPAISELAFILGISGLPLGLAYLYFTDRMSILTDWSEKLHPFFHLSSELPEFPEALGFNYRRVGMTIKKLFYWAAGGLALTYIFDYVLSVLEDATATVDSVSSGAASAITTQAAGEALGAMHGTNFLLTALAMSVVAAFTEELLFRGVVVNLWRRAFSVWAVRLDGETGKFYELSSKFFAKTGAYIAVLIAAALFALPHVEGMMSMFFFGIVAGVIYLQTRTIWAPILLHFLSNAVLAIVLFAGTLHGHSSVAADDAVPAKEIVKAVQAPLVPGVDQAGASATPVPVLQPASTARATDNLGVRFPGRKAVIKPEMASKVAHPVAVITQKDMNQPTFASSGNTLIQVCQSEQCASDMTLLQTLARKHPEVDFMQADVAAIPQFALQLRAQQQAMGKAKAGSSELSFPVYIYANQDLQVAPANTRSESDLEQFIQLGYTEYGADDTDELMATYRSKVCNIENEGPFDGKALYACVYDHVYNADLVLLDTAKRADFTKWQHKFDNTDDLNTEAGTEKAIRAMLSDLNEMHTHFFNAKQLNAMRDESAGKLSGIGLPLAHFNTASKALSLSEDADEAAWAALSKVTDESPLVVYPRPEKGQPADLAGLLRGDRIIEVNGQPTAGRTVNDVVSLIRGEAGTQVTLKVSRPNASGAQIMNFTVTRAKLRTSDVKMDMLDGGKAVVKVSQFGNYVSRDFTASLYKACTGNDLPADGLALAQLVNSYVPERDCSLKGLVIDLRDDRGGNLDQVIEMLETVMKEGPIVTMLARDGDQVVETRFSVLAGEERKEKLVNGKSVAVAHHARIWRVLPEGVPMAVLINRTSASASEIMSSALQKNGLATVEGEPSFGKEVGQSVTPVGFGTAVNLTTFRFKPADADLGAAVLPDFPVATSTAFLDDPLSNPDVVLGKALEVLARGKAALDEAKNADPAAKALLAEQARTMHAQRDSKYWEQRKAGLLN